MKIRQKLVLGFLAIGLLVAVVGGVSIKYTAEIKEDIDTIGLSNLGEVEGATRTAYYLQRIKSNVRELFLETIEQQPEEIARAKEVIEKSISRLQESAVRWVAAAKTGTELARAAAAEEEFVDSIKKTLGCEYDV